MSFVCVVSLTILLIPSSKSQLSWIVEFKECLIRDSRINRVVFILEKNNKLYADQVRELTAIIGNAFPIILIIHDVQKYFTYSRSIKQYVPTYTLCILPIAVTNQTPLTSMTKKIVSIYYMFQRHFQDPPSLMVIAFCAGNVNSTTISAGFKRLFRIDGMLVDRKIKLLEVTMIPRSSKASFLPSPTVLSTRVHIFNRYQKRTVTRQLTSIMKVFPIVIRNYYNHTLTMTLVPAAPHINVTLDPKTGCAIPKTLKGPHGIIYKVLAESSNFTWKIFMSGRSWEEQERNSKCYKTTFVPDILTGKIDVLGNFMELPLPSNASQISEIVSQLNRLTFVYVRRQESIFAVVPILHRNLLIELSNNFLSLFFATVVIVIFLKIITCLMRFSSDFWSVTNIWCAIFGIGLDNMPERTAERFVLTGMFIISTVYSVSVIDQLVDVQVNLNSEVELSTWDEFKKANLTFMASTYDYELLMDTGVPMIQNLAKTAVRMSPINETYVHKYNSTYSGNVTKFSEMGVKEICLENLVQKSFKNISCLTNAYMQGFIKTKVTVLKEPLVNVWYVIGVNPQMNIAKRFEQVIQYLTEAGLVDKWYKTEAILSQDEILVLKKMTKEDDTEDSSVIEKFLTVTLAGYIMSLILFSCEITLSWLKKKSCYLK